VTAEDIGCIVVFALVYVAITARSTAWRATSYVVAVAIIVAMLVDVSGGGL
jgi:hypothetical protein